VILLALILAGGLLIMSAASTAPDNAPLPADPAARAQRAREAIARIETRPEQQDILDAWARLETGNYRSMHGNSLYNIHVGSGAGDWNRKIAGYDGDGGAPLRDYDYFEQSIRDVILLLHRVSLYKEALAYYEGGHAEEFFAAVARGDGVQGYVGPATAKKADNYIAGLLRTYAEVTA
jgi:hypothetical protein